MGLLRLRIALGLSTERGAELLLQAIEGGDLDSQQLGDRLAWLGSSSGAQSPKIDREIQGQELRQANSE